MNVISGLTNSEVESRIKDFGPKEIEKKKSESVLIAFLKQFESPLSWILFIAGFLALLLGEKLEAGAIVGILVLNASFGFVLERRAATAIHALTKLTSRRAKVRREGRLQVIEAREVVPGDILVLDAGDVIAADAILTRASSLKVVESSLTGESEPVEKRSGDFPVEAPIHERVNALFMGTNVVAGSAEAVVTATGTRTELGKIAHMVSSATRSETPLEIRLKSLGQSLLWISLGAALVVGLLGLLQGKHLQDLIVFTISLAVACVPEGLPAVVTIALALGVHRMSKKNALVRNLSVIETLGNVTVICTDKTGTLTTGQMRLRDLWGENEKALLFAAAACCDAEYNPQLKVWVGDPTEIAILEAAALRGIQKHEIEILHPREKSYPFDSDRKRMSVLRRPENKLYLKGAFESLKSIATHLPAGIEEKVHEFAKRGLRVLAVGVGENQDERDIQVLGVLGLADPPRLEVKEALEKVKRAGIRTIMITGDHHVTAHAIANELGLSDSDSNRQNVLARATPEDKMTLVRSLKEQGEIVAMTGDGVNDAPALREAHVGIAMGKAGTEVARESSDLVLADDNYVSIVSAIEQGRGIFENIRKTVIYLFTGNLAEILLILAIAILALPMPFRAIHLLWINLVTDGLPALALAADPAPREALSRTPRSKHESLIGRHHYLQIALNAVIECGVTLAVYLFEMNFRVESDRKNLVFTTLVFSQIFRALSARSQEQIFWKTGPFSNKLLVGVLVFTLILQLSLHYIEFFQKLFLLKPLQIEDFVIAFCAGAVSVTLIEMTKLIKPRLARGTVPAQHRVRQDFE